MRIDGLTQMMARSLAAALPKAAPGFPLSDADQPARPQPVPGAAVMPTVQMLIALAAANPDIERRRRMAAAAEKGIKALETLHAALLAGTPSVEALREIAEWSQAVETPEDPALAQIMRDIDVRVRVELAKLDIEI